MTTAHPIILHHFEKSPFSEKVRVVFGLKNIEWTSVLISRIMPRPDLMPLTGGLSAHAGDADRGRHLLRHAMYHSRTGAAVSETDPVPKRISRHRLEHGDVDRPLVLSEHGESRVRLAGGPGPA